MDRRRRHLLCASALLGAPVAAWAQARPTPPELEGYQLQGEARMRFLGLSLYDIRLWTPAGPVRADSWPQQALALELQYLRSFEGLQIARRSLSEMQRQAPLPPAQQQSWLAEMQASFPDVQAGDRLTGCHEPGQGTRFYANGRERRRIADAEFSRLFFGIWLAPQTSEPALRQALLEPGRDRR
ncbi:chalcone isomerase family protein [Paucibacter sp. APW11]|uniref:Chalcone isomerase family protein n=1 Tax=Roseateles aquae TaxID=3077235 RepID=A0ABU3PA62_9BURK|nr:chalcone isomerase family protein [Paucibacter sp. APW11]MDT8999466.1 chalcone isomerase family protein [Paucibacter sp. APW11]